MRLVPVAVVAWFALAAVASAQSPPDEARFEKVLLDNNALTQPMRIAVASDGRVFYIERDGRVKIWSPETESTTVAGSVATAVLGETGLIGLALAPDFDETGHVYLHRALPDYRTSWTARVSRYTIVDNRLDPSSEVPIIDIEHPAGAQYGHDAGDLLMTPDGLLFIATGDNTICCLADGFPPTDERPNPTFIVDAQGTSANTNSLIGKILRIRPKPDGGYTIPDGNIFPESEDTADKTRPEIYAMGFRNPFTLGDHDPATGALWMADYGPDAVLPDPQRGPAGHVKLHLITEAGFYGWPYCTMNNVPYNDWDFANDRPGPWFDCQNPVNDSPNNTGLVNLPPAKPAEVWYTYSPTEPFPELYGGGAMAGPMYRYDAVNPSPTKFPEWFDGRRFFFDWTQNWVQTTRFDGRTPVDMTRFLPGFEFNKPMDMAFGRDGSLYVLEYGTGWGSSNDDSGLYRIDYVEGNRRPVVRATASADSGPLPLTVEFDASASTDPDGDALTYSWDFDGDGTADASGAKVSLTYRTPGAFAPRVTVTDAHGASAVSNLSVVAGNARPQVTLETPEDGTFSEFGDPIPFKVDVTDLEDGAIDCTKVRVTYSLGHNEHAHQQAEASVGADCTGVLTPAREGGHAGTTYVYHVIQAFYTDAGGAGSTPALTGEAGVVLHPRRYAAETYQEGEGVGLYIGKLFVPGSGNWFMFPRIDVRDMSALRMQIYSFGTGATVTVRADSPTGPVMARYTDIPSMPPRTGFGFPEFQWFSAPLTDPGGVHDLYVVVEWPDELAQDPEIFIGDFEFLDRPPALTASLDPAHPTGANGWYTSSPVTVRIDTGDAPRWTPQTSVDGGTTWQYSADGTRSISAEGVTTVLYRAVDPTDRVAPGGSVTVRIDTQPPETTARVDRCDRPPRRGHSCRVTVTLTAGDATSGVARTEYRLDNGRWRRYRGRFRVGNGRRTVTYRSIDRAGNLEAAKTLRLRR